MNRRIKGCDSPAQLSGLVLEEVKNFDSANAAHALSRLAKMFRKRTPLLDGAARDATYVELQPAVEALTKRMHQLIGSYDSWDSTLSLWSYGQLGHYDEAALRALCGAALEVAPIFKPADCANTLVAFANLDFIHRELLKQVVSTVLDTLDEFAPGEVTQVLWGFARLGCHPGEAFLTAMEEMVQWRMAYYSSQELVLVLWAMARLRHAPGPRFLQLAEATLLQRLPHLVPSDVCVSIWAFAHLRYKAVRFLDEVPLAFGPQLASCKNCELCALVSGFATCHHYHRSLLEAAAGVLLERMEGLSCQELCVALWTYGTFRHRPANPDFARGLAAALAARMRRFTPQGLAMIAKGLAQLQWRSEALMEALAAAAEAQMAGFKPLELSQLLWGLSALQCRNLGIYYAVVRRCIAILQDERHPQHRTMLQHRVVNSVVASCQQRGYVPWTLIDFAESKGIRVKQPDSLRSRDEEDEAMAGVAPQQLGQGQDPAAQAQEWGQSEERGEHEEGEAMALSAQQGQGQPAQQGQGQARHPSAQAQGWGQSEATCGRDEAEDSELLRAQGRQQQQHAQQPRCQTPASGTPFTPLAAPSAAAAAAAAVLPSGSDAAAAHPYPHPHPQPHAHSTPRAVHAGGGPRVSSPAAAAAAAAGGRIRRGKAAGGGGGSAGGGGAEGWESASTQTPEQGQRREEEDGEREGEGPEGDPWDWRHDVGWQAAADAAMALRLADGGLRRGQAAAAGEAPAGHERWELHGPDDPAQPPSGPHPRRSQHPHPHPHPHPPSHRGARAQPGVLAGSWSHGRVLNGAGPAAAAELAAGAGPRAPVTHGSQTHESPRMLTPRARARRVPLSGGPESRPIPPPPPSSALAAEPSTHPPPLHSHPLQQPPHPSRPPSAGGEGLVGGDEPAAINGASHSDLSPAQGQEHGAELGPESGCQEGQGVALGSGGGTAATDGSAAAAAAAPRLLALERRPYRGAGPQSLSGRRPR